MRLGLVSHGDEAAAAGPPLVLVHGGATAYQCFDPVVPLFAAAGRRVVAYDRRGRGLSDDGAAYSIAREAQDLVEVAAAVGGGAPVDVFGYSYGGMIALSALASGAGPSQFRRVVVYEPPFAVPGMLPDGLVDDVSRLLDEGDVDQALRQFVGRTFYLPDVVVDLMQQHPLWQVSVDTAPTLLREFAAVSSTPVPTSLPAGVPVRVLVAAADGNPAFRGIAAAVPGADVVTVGGVPHFAIPTDTDTVAQAVLSFTAPT